MTRQAYLSGLSYLTEKNFLPGTIPVTAREQALKHKQMREYGLSEKAYREVLPELHLCDEMLQGIALRSLGSGVCLGKAARSAGFVEINRNSAGGKVGGYSSKIASEINGNNELIPFSWTIWQPI